MIGDYGGMRHNVYSSWNEFADFSFNGKYITFTGFLETGIPQAYITVDGTNITYKGNNYGDQRFVASTSSYESFLNVMDKNGTIRWCLGLFEVGTTGCISQHRPLSVKMRSISDDVVVIYGTESSGGSYILSKMTTDLYWNVNMDWEVNVNQNCGSHIEANEFIIVLACPTYSSYKGTVTVLAEETGSMITDQLYGGQASQYFGQTIAIQGVYNTYYSIFISEINIELDRVFIRTLDLYFNRRAPNIIMPFNNGTLQLLDETPYYGEYFTFDQTGTLFMTGASNFEGSNNVLIAKMCLHNEYLFNSECVSLTLDTDPALSPEDTFLTLGWQDSDLISCVDLDITQEQQRYISESFCDYLCASFEFGPNCTSCSQYMNSAGVILNEEYTWDNTLENQCRAINEEKEVYCNSFTECYDCVFSEYCYYDGQNCHDKDSYIPTNQNISTNSSECAAVELDEDYEYYCGEYERDLRFYENISDIKPNVLTPQSVLCKYKLIYNQLITDTWTIKYDKISVEIVVEESTERRLNSFDRNLETETIEFIISEAPAILLTYYSRKPHMPNWTIETEVSYCTSPSSSNTTSTNTPNQSASNSNETVTNYNILIIVFTVMFGLLLLCGITFVVYIKKRRQSSTRVVNLRTFRGHEYEPPSQSRAWSAADLEIFFFFNTEKEYCEEINEFKTQSCAVCLEEFRTGVPVRVMPNCKHVFHSDCIYEAVRSSSGPPKCPLCNNPLAVIDNNGNEDSDGESPDQLGELRRSRTQRMPAIRINFAN